MFDKELFIARLIELRKTHNFSQSEMGSIIGTTKQGVNEIEKGRNSVNVEKLTLLADYFEVSTDYLLGRTDNPIINR